MEASAGVATGCRVSPPMPSSQPSRKEWTAASNSSTEDVERSKMGQSDERTMHEQGTGPLDVDFCSIMIDGSSNNDLLHQRLHGVSRQREELQQMEIELRAQIIARAEMLEMQKSFDTQIKEHANAAAKLKEKLQESDQCILDLERKMEEADRELRAIKFDNEAAWAKDDLLREQDKELATFRRERHNSEAERAQHLKQIHELNEHINKKESQVLELEEQHKAAQETILFKDEQLREAQAWVARAQEMDALQSTTNHSLQAELRERTEQFNQFWIGCQRQFAEMERLHFQTIQQLQLELAEARKGNGFSGDEAQTGHTNSKDASADNGNQISVKEGGTFNGNSENLPNSNTDCIAPVPVGSASTQIDHVPGVLTVPSSLPGMDAFLPPGQMTGLHPFVMYQQGLHHFVPSANSHMPQTHVSHFHTVPAIQPHQHWPNQQVVSENPQIPNQNQCQLSQAEQSVLKSDANSVYDLPGDGQIVHSDYLGADISPLQPSGPVITSSSKETQVLVSNDKQYVSSPKPHQTIQENSSQFHNTLRLDPLQLKTDPKVSLENNVLNSSDKSSESESAGLSFRQRNDENAVGLISQPREKLGLSAQLPLSDTTESAANHRGDSTDANKYNPSGAVLCDTPISAGQTSNTLVVLGRSPQPAILDERSLLACIVRAVPPVSGGQIRISTTLPNRLGKMLAPFHWHDYRKQYGKLDEFVARHPELFVIEGDFIHLREGAQEIISATTAAAKVAAAAAAVTTPYSSVFPSVAVTPVAQPHRLKQVPTANNPSYSPEKQMQYQQSNGISYNVAQGLSNVKATSKSKDILKLNGLSSKVKSVHLAAGNGSNNGRTGLPMVQNKESNNGSQGLNYGGKQQGRGTGDALTPRRY